MHASVLAPHSLFSSCDAYVTAAVDVPLPLPFPSAAFCAANNWLANTVVALTFSSMQKALSDYSFLPFAGVLALGLAFILAAVPETRGRSLADIQAEFASQEKEPLMR